MYMQYEYCLLNTYYGRREETGVRIMNQISQLMGEKNPLSLCALMLLSYRIQHVSFLTANAA